MKDVSESKPYISLIIPAYNEEAYLPKSLDAVEKAQENYHGGKDAIEVIVADNLSTDSTSQIAQSRGCRVVSIEKRIIAAVRNAGASAAQGQIVVFVDADTQIHPDTFNAIDKAMSSSNIVAGASGVRLDRMSPGIAAAYIGLLPLVWLTRMDTGVVFCRREDFKTVGGYDETKHFAEDVDFLLKLRRLGKTRKQRLTRLRTIKAIASTRKFDKHGDWHYVLMMLKAPYYIFFAHQARDKFVKTYWYEDER